MLKNAERKCALLLIQKAEQRPLASVSLRKYGVHLFHEYNSTLVESSLSNSFLA